MAELIETGKISTRGQVAIPTNISKKMHLKEGQKILFVLEGNALLIKKIEDLSWEEITKPLRKTAEKTGLKEEDIPKIIDRVRTRR